MSATVEALLEKLTIPEKVEVLQILLDALPDDVMWPSWLADKEPSHNADQADDLRLREDAPEVEWPEKVAVDPDHFLRRLSIPELAQMTETLWGDVGDELPIPDWIIEELEERRRRVESGEVKLLTIEEAMAAVRKQVGL
jgi:hypothetical protein